MSVVRTCEMIVEPHHGEHLFTQINASKHTRHTGEPRGGVVALCLRWKGQTLLPQEIQTWPAVGCSTVINSALCVSIFENSLQSTENGFVELSKTLFMCIKVCKPLLKFVFFFLLHSFWLSRWMQFCLNCLFLLQHAYSWIAGVCPSSFTFRHLERWDSPLHHAEKTSRFGFYPQAP